VKEITREREKKLENISQVVPGGRGKSLVFFFLMMEIVFSQSAFDK